MSAADGHIAIFLPTLGGGGAERCMVWLANGLAERGYRVDLVLVRAEGEYLNDVAPRVAMVPLEAKRALFALPALARYLRRERPAVLLSVLDYANVVALCARRLARVQTRVAVNEQNTISITTLHARQRRQRWVPSLMRICYPWADHVIGNSRGVADDLSQLTRLPRSRIDVIYNPVVTPSVRMRAREPLAHPWFAVDEPPVALAVGRLVAQKDFPTLLRAVARVRRRVPIRLVILGEGPERAVLETLAAELRIERDVWMPGFVANPYPYMAAARLFVLSSRWEGLPTVLIEAIACGTPVVATDCPSGPREILQDGRYGSLVPVGDVEAMAAAIQLVAAGGGTPPSEESWRPYELESVVDEYVRKIVAARVSGVVPQITET